MVLPWDPLLPWRHSTHLLKLYRHRGPWVRRHRRASSLRSHWSGWPSRGQRIGEATNPGPAIACPRASALRCGLLLPTPGSIAQCPAVCVLTLLGRGDGPPSPRCGTTLTLIWLGPWPVMSQALGWTLWLERLSNSPSPPNLSPTGPPRGCRCCSCHGRRHQKAAAAYTLDRPHRRQEGERLSLWPPGLPSRKAPLTGLLLNNGGSFQLA